MEQQSMPISGTKPSFDGIYYRKKRYILYIILTAISLALPFIKIGEAHLILLSFDHKQLHLLGTIFDMQEFYLLPFISILLFLSIFFMTTLAGRMWCGWICPQTIFRVIFRDLLETKIFSLRKKISNKQKDPDMSLWDNKIKYTGVLVIWASLCCLISANFLWFFVPPEDFFQYLFIDGFVEHPILGSFFLGLAAFLFFDISMIKENFCFYVCPYCRIQTVLYDKDTLMAIYDHKRGGLIYDQAGIKKWKKPEEAHAECTGCEACVTVCPTHIDIRKGLQLECINCLECVDACSKVMGNLGKKSLVNWTSEDHIKTRQKVPYFRSRIIAYIIALSITFIALVFMSGTKEPMLLNINHSSELYSVHQNGSVENAYSFLFQNTSDKTLTYYFEILDHPSITIKRPTQGLRLEAGEKSKMVVVLESQKNINTNSEDLSVPITIRAFAQDDNAVWVKRESIFVYPGVK